ncbi:hypothetical protein [Haloferax larsenii]|uniref:Envelope protein N-terminal domain-containing protein n=1 Tax=Haloferax larsenii TaxID=302484 RepID=A0A1H7QQM1_HALLR|nr:hypothetical protein [Haloferax larsenii]SEL50301.1 hypothetical protein SAMN04488691_105122 [Haloferax larsenii]
MKNENTLHNTVGESILNQEEPVNDLDDSEELKTSKRTFLKGLGTVGGLAIGGGTMLHPDNPYAAVEDADALLGTAALVGVSMVVAGAVSFYSASQRASAKTKLVLQDDLYSNAIQEQSERENLTSKPDQVDYISRTLIGDAIIKAVDSLNDEVPQSEARNRAVEHLNKEVDKYVNNVIQFQNAQVMSFLDDVKAIQDFSDLNFQEAWMDGSHTETVDSFLAESTDDAITRYVSNEYDTYDNDDEDVFAHIPVEYELNSGKTIIIDMLVYEGYVDNSMSNFMGTYTALPQSGSQILDSQVISEGISAYDVSQFEASDTDSPFQPVAINDPYQNQSQQFYLNPSDINIILDKLETIRENARQDFYGIVDDIYANYEPGELDVSNIQIPTQRLLDSSESYLDGNDQAQQIVSYTLGHTSTSSDSTDFQKWSWTDSSGNTVNVNGFLTTDKTIGQLSKGDTVDLSTSNVSYADVLEPAENSQTTRYNVKGKILTFNGAVDAGGNEVTTIDATANPVTQTDISDMKTKLEKLQEDRQEQSAKVELDVGGIGGALFGDTLGKNIEQYGLVAGGIVGLLVVLNVISN